MSENPKHVAIRLMYRVQLHVKDFNKITQIIGLVGNSKEMNTVAVVLKCFILRNDQWQVKQADKVALPDIKKELCILSGISSNELASEVKKLGGVLIAIHDPRSITTATDSDARVTLKYPNDQFDIDDMAEGLQTALLQIIEEKIV